jgi:hypothetical protein
MEAKEKARELVDKFSNVALLDSYEAKQCALIAVDEILEALNSEENVYLIGDSSYIDFWNNVKQEIENYEKI